MTGFMDLKQGDWPVPSEKNLRRVGSKNFEIFFSQGMALSNALKEEMEIAFEKDIHTLEILDFGCGCGRVSIPLSKTFGKLYCTDIDSSAIQFLSENLQDCECSVNQFFPPLLYPDSRFDAVYSVSVWTHLNPEAGLKWLNEIHRVIKPGGVFFNSIMSHTSLVYRRLLNLGDWAKISNRDLRDKGVMFVEYDQRRDKPEEYPGVEDEYGITFLDDQYVKSEWAGIFDSIEILPGRMTGQDLVIMKKAT